MNVLTLPTECRLNGYQYVLKTLEKWGVTLYTGVTGGGIIHFLKYLPPRNHSSVSGPAFFTIAEYPAGFVPLGHFLASGHIAAAVATTGAATKLLSCGLSDAKLHDIPAIYIMALSGEETHGKAPLQDTSEYGSNILQQLRSELPDSIFVLNSPDILDEQLHAAQCLLKRSKPVVLILRHDAMIQSVTHTPHSAITKEIPGIAISRRDLMDFFNTFRRNIQGRRVVILVGEEMGRYPNADTLIASLSRTLRGATLCSINGVNAIKQDDDYYYGCISFGGNDEALALFRSLNKDDVLIVLGACLDEYTVNLKKPGAGILYCLSGIPNGYGKINNSFKHMTDGAYYHLTFPLDKAINTFVKMGEKEAFSNIAAAGAPNNLNHSPYAPARAGYVDMATLYCQLEQWWPENAIGFHDICLSYKDYHYVVQRPNNRIRLHSFYRGSAMGGAFGAAIGAKLSAPQRPVFLFTGDGCFRLFSGSLGEARGLGLVVFLLNNAELSIVSQGLPIILPDIAHQFYHSTLTPLDYCAIARACGWQAERLRPDLGNLMHVLSLARKGEQSLLIDIPVDPLQILGKNPRVSNL